MAMRHMRIHLFLPVSESIKDEWEPIKRPTLAQLMAGR